MGLHFVDMIIVAAIGLALFGPKALQSVAREAGKTVSQAKQAKDKVMAEVPLVDEVTKIKDNIPQVPLNSRQALEMLMDSDKK
jgi:Sec-independent protein translocase protein TatA